MPGPIEIDDVPVRPEGHQVQYLGENSAVAPQLSEEDFILARLAIEVIKSVQNDGPSSDEAKESSLQQLERFIVDARGRSSEPESQLAGFANAVEAIQALTPSEIEDIINTPPTVESIAVYVQTFLATIPESRAKSIAKTNLETGFLWLQQAVAPTAND